MNSKEALKVVKEYFEKVKPRYNAKLEIEDLFAGSGFNAKALKKDTEALF